MRPVYTIALMAATILSPLAIGNASAAESALNTKPGATGALAGSPALALALNDSAEQRQDRRANRQASRGQNRATRQNRRANRRGNVARQTRQARRAQRDVRDSRRDVRQSRRAVRTNGATAGERRELRRDRRELRQDRSNARSQRNDVRQARAARQDRREYRQNRNYRQDRRAWNRSWRSDRRYNWRNYRNTHRNIYNRGRYYSPYRNRSYSRFTIGLTLGSGYYGSRYWINNPSYYRLPPAYGNYRWVRYYDDVLLVDIYTGYVADVIYDFYY